MKENHCNKKYHWMAVADSRDKLLEEVASLESRIRPMQLVRSMSLKKDASKRGCTREMVRTSSSLNRTFLQILSKSSPPEAYSMTIARWVGVKITCRYMIEKLFLLENIEWWTREWASWRSWLTSLNLIMLGCFNDRWFIISRWTLSSICTRE